MNKTIHITESELHELVTRAITEVVKNYNGDIYTGLKPAKNIPSTLYHTAMNYQHDSIAEHGLIAKGNYNGYWTDGDEDPDLPDAVFLFSDIDNPYGQCQDDFCDMEVWAVDTRKLDKGKFFIDPTPNMAEQGCFCYLDDIPPSCLTFYGTGEDPRFGIYE